MESVSLSLANDDPVRVLKTLFFDYVQLRFYLLSLMVEGQERINDDTHYLCVLVSWYKSMSFISLVQRVNQVLDDLPGESSRCISFCRLLASR